MDPSPPSDARARREPTTRLLNSLAQGDPAATEQVVARVQEELRRLAAGHMQGQRRDHTLQPTALVNEVWIRMFGQEELHFEGRRQFFRFASRVMRSVLVDHARAAGTAKRGGGGARLSISSVRDEPGETGGPGEVDLLDLDEALAKLERFDPELGRLIELRFFGGLSNPAVAEVLETSLRTVERQWSLARAWLLAELTR